MRRLTLWISDVYDGSSIFRPKDVLTIVGVLLFLLFALVGNALVG